MAWGEENDNKIKSSVGVIFNKREYNRALAGRQPVMHLCCCSVVNVKKNLGVMALLPRWPGFKEICLL